MNDMQESVPPMGWQMWLADFVRESNRIEGILREPSHAELDAHVAMLDTETVNIEGLKWFVSQVQPDAMLRDRPDVPGVRVGNHIAPPSGSAIRKELENILWCYARPETRSLGVKGAAESPFSLHRAYETLHPFTDGNGRSGRALWLWMMLRADGRRAAMAQQLGFLHCWYYQSLEESRDSTRLELR